MNFDPATAIGPATEDTVLDYESRIGARLPEDYRNYLLLHNGSTPEKVDYWMPHEENWIESIEEMSGLGDSGNSRSLFYYLDGDHGIPEGWIPIAHSGYGDFTVLSVRPEDYGHVYYLFHEVHGYDASNRTEGVYHLADSFTSWLACLDNLGDDEDAT